MDYAQLRRRMVEDQLIARGIADPRVIAAMASIERHRFIPGPEIANAYADQPVGIARGQTVSQPYIVALMSESMRLTGNEKVLEIGTGSGYQAAVLAELAGEVYTVERFPDLSHQAELMLGELGYTNIRFSVGDGSLGWKDAAPFDRILITAASPRVPFPLLEQLKEGGMIMLPVGETPFSQVLAAGIKKQGRIELETVCNCAFVPLIGEFGMMKK
jgi:protein-L-isoaspartate(D-aspartate) O-methyltransferase